MQEEKYAGESATNKIKKIQNLLKRNLIDYYLLNSLDSIAWLLNLRGNDIKYTPLNFANLIIPQNGKIELFIDINKVKSNLKYLNTFARIHPFDYLDDFSLADLSIQIDHHLSLPFLQVAILSLPQLEHGHLVFHCL